MPAPPPPPPPPPPLPSRGAAKRTLPPPPPPPSSSRPTVASRVQPRAVSPPPPVTDVSMPTGLTSDTIPSLPPAPTLPSPPSSTRTVLPPPPPPPPQLSHAEHVSSGIHTKFPSFTMDVDGPLPDITNRASGGADRNVASISNKPWEKSLDYGKIQHAVMDSKPSHGDGDDDDDDGDDAMDIPHRFTMRPGAAAARLDLQRCTIRVHKQLVNQMQTNSMKPQAQQGSRATTAPASDESLSRCQGELWLKSRFPMMGWKKRYGSIVDHSYFGPVLFLFKYDAKGNVALHHSLMIVLVDSRVRLGKNSTTKDNDYRCEFVLRTTKRRYTIAANHTMRRDYWLRNLEGIQKHATTSYS